MSEKQEAISRQLTETIDAIVWRFDIENDKWLYVSPQIEKILGYKPEEWTDLQSWVDMMHSDDQTWAPNFCYTQTQLKLPHNFEYRLYHKDGSIKWIYDKVGVEIIDGKPAYLFGVMFDISYQKENEFKLKEREQRLHSLVKILQYETDSINNLLDYTLEETIKLTNSEFGYIYFYSEEKAEFTLYSWSKNVMKECTVVDPQTNYQLEKTGIWGEAVRQRKPIMVNNFTALNPLKKGYPAGHVHLKKFLSIPVFDEKKIVAVIGVGNKEIDYSDIDILNLTLVMDSAWKVVQNKRIEELMKIQNDNLSKLNADKDRLMTILSHDLKNPFNAILGYLSLLSKNLRLYDIEKIDAQISIINQSAKNYYELLDQLLLWVRSQSGKISCNPVSLMLIELLNEVSIEMQFLAKNKQITIEITVLDGLSVFADENMLKTIIRNLLSNAIKFSRNGGLVCINAEQTEEIVLFSISDNGVGIEPDKLANLFDFSKVTTTTGTNGEKGTGLGLVVCNDFVEKHGGKIWAKSELGKGSTFYFTIE